MLEVCNIHKMYEGKPLLEGVSFKVDEGETVCLLGASGSGKSTLLRIISGLEEAEQGAVIWNGKDLKDVAPHQRKFGLMFQDYALFPHRSVFQNVAFGLRMQDLLKEAVKTRTQKALATINMLDFANRRVTDLSGGEQQRVALARALAPEPQLLMLDEPLGALDRSLREQLSQELRRILHNTQIPTIYVTHDQAEAFAIADRLVLLHDGKVIRDGAPEEIYINPRSAWVAEFFGLGNLVSGTVTQQDPPVFKTALGIFEPAKLSGPFRVGEQRTLLLRPEEARLCSQKTEESFCIEGIISDCIFVGQAYQLTITTESEILLTIRAESPYEKGMSVHVNYPPEGIQILEE